MVPLKLENPDAKHHPATPYGIGREMLVGAVLIAAIVSALSFYTLWVSYKYSEARQFVAKSRDVLSALEDVRTTLIDVDSHSRGYVVTGDEIYLEQYEQLLTHMRDAIGRLRAGLADAPGQVTTLQNLDTDIQARLNATRTFVETRRTQGFDAARALIVADIPVRGSAGVREVLKKIEQRQDELLQIRDRELDTNTQRFGFSVAALVLFLAIILAYLFVVIRRRQYAETRLHQTEQHFRLMAENIIEYAILLLDPEGRITTWTSGAERIKGYRADEIIGRHFSCFYPAAEIERGKPKMELEQAAANGRFQDEGWRLRKDGTRFWAYVVITAIRDDTGTLQGYAKVTRDMTDLKASEEALRTEVHERKKTEAALVESNTHLERRVAERTTELERVNEELRLEKKDLQQAQQVIAGDEARMRGILDSAMDAIITIDEDERIVLFNRAAENVFTCPSEEALGTHLSLFLPERFRDAHSAHIKAFGEAGVKSRRMGEQRIVTGLRRDGTEFPIEAAISHIQDKGKRLYTVILRDVTERRASQEALERSEARLRSILDSAMDAIITVDETQRIVLFNAAAEGVFSCSRDVALGAPLTKFIPERFRAEHANHVTRFGQTGASSRRMGAQRIVMGLRSNGEEFPIEASISQVTEHGHRFFTVILRDVTVRVLAEAALKASKDELRELASAAHTVREQEKSRIARELHDELAQSLTSMKMDVATAQQELAAGQEWLSSKFEVMQTTLDGMVMATRRIAADLRPLMLDDLGLVPAAEWLVQTFTQRTGIRCTFSADPPELTLQDPYATAIFRILQESLANVGRHAHASLVEVTLDANGDMIVLRVRDNGRGFEPAGPRKPASLGLIGLRERATLLDGEMHIDAAPGRGTVVEVHIPLKNIGLSQ